MSQVQSLPTVLPESFNTSGKILEIRSAYSTTLLLEHAASSNTDPKIRERKLIHARVLGHLLREAPSMLASENVAIQVNSCQNNDQLDALGEMYFLHYICYFRIQTNDPEGPERTRSLSCSPESPPYYQSIKTRKELVEYMLRTSGEPSRCSEEAKRRALVRDNFRCTVTGRYDYRSLPTIEDDQEAMESSPEATSTECVHIFPQSIDMTSGIDDKDVKPEHAASIWDIMSYFGFEDLREKLVGNGVHTLENVMTIDLSFGFFFQALGIWFEAIDDQDNTYAIRARSERILQSCKENPITLTSHHPDLPLPNRTILAIHAACCRIAGLSGAAKYIKKTLDDMEVIRPSSEPRSLPSQNSLETATF